MSEPTAKLYIVEAGVLPEIFREVSRAKELLETGEVQTVAEAVSRIGISRSAFYKYRDAIRPFRNFEREQVVTISVIMRDRPGSLSSVLAIFAGINANILTINQSIPTDGAAIVTISFTAEDAGVRVDALRTELEGLSEVIRTELLAG